MRIYSTVQLCSITSLWHSGQHLCRAIGRLQVRISLGFWLFLKGAHYEVDYSGKKTYLAGLQCTLTSSCAKTEPWAGRRLVPFTACLDLFFQETFALFFESLLVCYLYENKYRLDFFSQTGVRNYCTVRTELIDVITTRQVTKVYCRLLRLHNHVKGIIKHRCQKGRLSESGSYGLGSQGTRLAFVLNQNTENTNCYVHKSSQFDHKMATRS